MKLPRQCVSRVYHVAALQWTGDNVAAVQAFVAPTSPYWLPGGTLAVPTRDRKAEAQWPTLGEQMKQESVALGSWLIIREGAGPLAGQLEVVTAKDFGERFEYAHVHAGDVS